jgi:hypothetical protein
VGYALGGGAVFGGEMGGQVHIGFDFSTRFT